MNSVPKLFSCSYADCWTEKHFSTEFCVLTPNHTHSHTLFWGAFQGGSGERLHGMQEVSGSIPLFSTKKAPYFAGSTVLFFLLKPIFGGCIASPAPFSGFCRQFLYTPPIFDFTPFSKRNVCRPFFQQAVVSSPSMYGVRSKLKVMLS